MVEGNAAWQRLLAASDISEYAAAWLALQCRQLGAGVRGAVYFAQQADDEIPAVATEAAETEAATSSIPAPVASFPQHALDDDWQDVAAAVFSQGRGVVAEPDRVNGRLQVVLGCPVCLEDGRTVAAIVVSFETPDNAGIGRAMESLRWGVSGLELAFVRQGRQDDGRLLARSRAAWSVLAAALEAKDFHGAVLAAVTTLASRLGCDRTGWGVIDGLGVRIEALSHTTQHVPNTAQLRALVAGMEDVLHAGMTIRAASADTPGLRALVHESGIPHVLCVPGYSGGSYRAVLLLERAARAFDDEECKLVESTLDLLLPLLEWRRVFAQDLRERLRIKTREAWASFWAPVSTTRRYVAFGTLAVLLLLALVPVQYRVTAEVTLEGEERRAVVAPFDGFLATSPLRAGDVVEEGDELATLDDRDLRLEQLKWIGQSAQYQAQYQDALGTHDRAKVNISLAQLQQADAELKLVATRLERTRITAPIAGLVLEGDLSQRLGSRVSQGEMLFTIAPLSDYRVVLRVDERYITEMSAGQGGNLILSSLPDDKWAFEVTRVTAIAVAEGGINYFRVEGRLLSPGVVLRPGMEGVGKINAGYRPLLVVWLQPVADWMRLWFWRWLP